MKKPFTTEQLRYIEEGEYLAKDLARRIQIATGVLKPKAEPFRHHYIMSPPGAGKTYTVLRVTEQHKIPTLQIMGTSSMSAFVTTMAVEAYMMKQNKVKAQRIVWIDDCDSLFTDAVSLNVMKGVLDKEREVLAWNKNLTIQIQGYLASTYEDDVLKGMALQSFCLPGTVGVNIPMHQFRFLVTSNKQLAMPNDSGNYNTPKERNEAAVRDRLEYQQYNLTSKQSWGWLASVMLPNKALGLTLDMKHILLDFMYMNWQRLASTSLREVQRLASCMINNPDGYPNDWENRLIPEPGKCR